MSRASGGDGNPVELFQILKDDAVKVLHPIQNSAAATGLEKVSFHYNPKEAMPKNVQTTAKLHSSHTLVK